MKRPRRLSIALALIAALLLAGCSGVKFIPYDYKKSEPAKIKTKNYNFRWQSQKLKIERNF